MEVSGKRIQKKTAPLEHGTQSRFDFFCQPCDIEGNHLEAEGYCETCKEYLCNTCFKHHRRPTATKHHVLLDKEQMPRAYTPSNLKPVIICTQICGTHVREIIKYFCEVHNQLGCSECMRQEHRACKSVLYIPDAAGAADHAREYEKLTKHIEEVSKDVEIKKKDAEQYMEQATKYGDIAISGIDAFQEKATLHFERLANAMKKKVETERNTRQTEIQNECVGFNDMLHDIEQLSVDLATTHGSERKGDAFVAVKKAEKRLLSMTRDMSKWNQTEQYSNIIFKPNEELLNKQTRFGWLTVEPEHQQPHMEWMDHATDKEQSPIPAGRSRFLGVRVTDDSSSMEQFSMQNLDVGQSINVYIVFITNPDDFYCQLIENCISLDELMAEMNNFYGKLSEGEMLLGNIRKGQPCAAKFSDDNMWYRAEILNAGQNDVDVLFVDYGNTETVSVKKVRKLIPDFLKLNRQGLKCGIDGVIAVNNSWSDKAIADFEDSTMEKEVVAKIVSKKSNSRYLMDVHARINIGEALCEKGHCSFDTIKASAVKDEIGKELINAAVVRAEKEESREESQKASPMKMLQYRRGVQLAIDANEAAYVTNIDSISNFWCQLVRSSSQLDSVLAQLESHCKSGTGLTNFPVGFACGAKYSEDGCWYRGKVTAAYLDSIEVLFVDYGNTETVPLDDVCELTEDLVNLEPLAVKCELDSAGNASNQLREKFIEMIADHDVTLTVCGIRDDAAVVRVVLPDGRNVGQLLGLSQASADAVNTAGKTKDKTGVRKDNETVFLAQSIPTESEATVQSLPGTQPDGSMTTKTQRWKECCGYEQFGRIDITYTFPNGVQGKYHPTPGKPYKRTTRVAYLPDNTQGQKISKMLKVAFDRKLVFTIGRSTTTGQSGVITWNGIQHKTNPSPHTQCGYPDPGYLDRVTDELAAKGVTERDIYNT